MNCVELVGNPFSVYINMKMPNKIYYPIFCLYKQYVLKVNWGRDLSLYYVLLNCGTPVKKLADRFILVLKLI